MLYDCDWQNEKEITMTRKLFLLALLLLPTSLAKAADNVTVDFVSVKECRSFAFGKINEEQTQNKINQKLKQALAKVKIKRLVHVQYGDFQDLIRDKDNACIIATAWFETSGP